MILSLLLAGMGTAATAQNINLPIIQTKYTADPAPYVHNDTVYLYTTHDEDGAEGFLMKDWLLYTSTDMVNWQDRGAVASLKDFKWFKGENGAWAEQVIERNGKWYMYCPIHGNGIGVGLFDVITKKVAEQLDLESMYANAIACNCLGDASVPCTVDDEETAIRVALKCCRNIDRDHPRIIRIQNTLHLGEIEVSEALLDAVRADSRMSLIEN